MLLSSPKTRLITFFKTRLIKFYHNRQLMTDHTYLISSFLVDTMLKNYFLLGKLIGNKFARKFFLLNALPNKPWISRVRSTSLLKTLWEKKNLIVTSVFSFSYIVFHPFREVSTISIKF